MKQKDFDEIKYPSVDYFENLIAPEVLIGQHISFQEKHDGSNIGIAIDENDEILIRTKRDSPASEQIYNYVKGLDYYDNILRLLKDCKHFYNGGEIILFGELMIKGKSPGKTTKHTENSFVMFDVWDCKHKMFCMSMEMHEIARNYDINSAKTIHGGTFSTLDELKIDIEKIKQCCLDKNIEGVVAKVCSELTLFDGKPREGRLPDDNKRIYFKIKPVIPKHKLGKPKSERVGSNLEELDESDINSSIHQAKEELGNKDFKNQKLAMPLIGKYVSEECKKHNRRRPQDLHERYLEELRD